MENYFSDKSAEELRNKYDEQRIDRAIDYLEESIRQDNNAIRNPIAFLKKAIDDGWVLPEVVQQNLQSSNPTESHNLQNEIRSLDETEMCQKLRLKLLDQIGRAPYASWVHPCKLTMTDSELSIDAPSDFTKDWIESKFQADIQSALRALDSEKKPKLFINFTRKQRERKPRTSTG